MFRCEPSRCDLGHIICHSAACQTHRGGSTSSTGGGGAKLRAGEGAPPNGTGCPLPGSGANGEGRAKPLAPRAEAPTEAGRRHCPGLPCATMDGVPPWTGGPGLWLLACRGLGCSGTAWPPAWPAVPYFFWYHSRFLSFWVVDEPLIASGPPGCGCSGRGAELATAGTGGVFGAGCNGGVAGTVRAIGVAGTMGAAGVSGASCAFGVAGAVRAFGVAGAVLVFGVAGAVRVFGVWGPAGVAAAHGLGALASAAGVAPPVPWPSLESWGP